MRIMGKVEQAPDNANDTKLLFEAKTLSTRLQCLRPFSKVTLSGAELVTIFILANF
jgi:hypothetical protein